jgi:mRNA-degrading endonuclease RelE of RelBE toxin-antitoxin system|tara:strand:- start:374 stop:550 length:177 start_codon:yes stop_codon:yes gene_type:complete
MAKIKIHPSVQKEIRSLSYEELIVLNEQVKVNEIIHKDDKPVLLKYLEKRIKKLKGEL